MNVPQIDMHIKQGPEGNKDPVNHTVRSVGAAGVPSAR